MSDITYKIIGANQNQGQIFVEYTYGDNSLVYDVHLPIVDGKYPNGDELARLIMLRAPTYIFERMSNLATVNFDEIAALVEPKPISSNDIKARILNQLSAIDQRSIRALREGDTTRITALEAEAAELRTQLAALT